LDIVILTVAGTARILTTHRTNRYQSSKQQHAKHCQSSQDYQ
jgi:hypothetical protein